MRIQFDPHSPSYLSWPNGRPVGGSMRNGYRRVRYEGKWISHHVLIWTLLHGEIPEGYEIDHIDRDRSNNNPDNLRLVTRSLNCRNRAIHKNNKSGIKGVYWHKHREVWYGQVRVAKVTKITKGYSTKEEAYENLLKLREELNYGNHL